MSIRSKIEIQETAEDLFSLKKQQTNFKSIQKIELLELLKQNPEVSREFSAKQINISLRTQSRWLNSYVENGLEVFIAKQTSSKKSAIVTSDIHKALSEKVHSSTDCFKGYWDALRWVQETYDIEITYFNLRAYMVKHFGTKLKKPRKSHYKKDQQAYESFLKNPNYTSVG